MKRANIPDVGAEIPENAISVYGQNDAMDDFPVLKAFQQYIDMEQTKARKRLLLICTFFGFVMIVLIAVFVVLLLGANSRNQTLNDRLVEYAMRDRDRMSGSPVVVQTPQDNTAIHALATKLEEVQKKLAESQSRAEKIAADAEDRVKKAELEASKPKALSKEAQEVIRLKALLEAEREKNSVEREKQRQAEIEAYRRKYYPEFYEPKKPTEKQVDDENTRQLDLKKEKRAVQREAEAADAEIEAILRDADAIRYFDEEKPETDESPARKPETKKPVPSPSPKAENKYSIPVEIKGSSSSWSIPLD